MFSQENVIKILQLSSQYYETTSPEKQKMLVDQVLALTTLPSTHVDHPQPPKMLRLPMTPSEWETKENTKSVHHATLRPQHHPPISKLINEAIAKLHQRNGSSLQAIKKFIEQSYHLDTCKLGRYIRKYLRDAVDHGILLHPKGKGATGHFKLAQRTKTMVNKKSGSRVKQTKKRMVRKKEARMTEKKTGSGVKRKISLTKGLKEKGTQKVGRKIKG